MFLKKIILIFIKKKKKKKKIYTSTDFFYKQNLRLPNTENYSRLQHRFLRMINILYTSIIQYIFFKYYIFRHFNF